MAVGNQPSAAQVNANLASDAIALREWANKTLQHWAEVNKLGLTGLQAAPVSMTAADAQAAINSANYMATIAQVYKGTATQTPAFNFEDALTSIWGEM